MNCNPRSHDGQYSGVKGGGGGGGGLVGLGRCEVVENN